MPNFNQGGQEPPGMPQGIDMNEMPNIPQGMMENEFKGKQPEEGMPNEMQNQGQGNKG